MSIARAQGGAVERGTRSGPEERRRLDQRHSALETERSSWDGQIKEILEHIAPRRLRMSASETNVGTKKNQKILNGVATKALRTLGSGMHAGMTSPARPWHSLTIVDPTLSEMLEVKAFLQQTADRQRSIFNRSNFYNALAQFYEDLGSNGTAVMWIDEDEEDTIRCHVIPWGEYVLACDHRGRPTTLFRRPAMTVSQMADRFGLSKCSQRVRDLYEAGKWDESIEVVHVVEKRAIRDITKVDGKNMPWASYWYEKKADPEQGFLKEWGYEECPFVAARWSVTGNDTYGTGPSFDALGDMKGLQELERKGAKGAAMIVEPPMRGPASMRGGPSGPSIVPGAMAYGGVTHEGVFEPSVKVPEQAIKIFDEKILRQELRIKEAFFADLWLMLAQSDRREITAREVDEKHDEKMLQLGPVLVRLYDELLDPAIDRIFAIMVRKKMIPPVPDVLQGVELRVEYISILAQAQKLLSTSAVERFIAFVGNVAAVRPDVLDRVNWDEMVRHYGDILGIKPDLILPDNIVAKIRESRQRVEAQAQAMAMGQAQADQAATLAKAKTDTPSMLTARAPSGGVPAAPGGFPMAPVQNVGAV